MQGGNAEVLVRKHAWTPNTSYNVEQDSLEQTGWNACRAAQDLT